MTMLDLRSEFDEGVGIAYLRGEIDASNRDEVLDQLLRVLRNADFGLVLDLTEVRYLDSAGIDLILRLGQRLGSRQQALRVVAPASGFVSEVLETVRLSELVPVDASVPDAVEALDEPRPERRGAPPR